MHDQLYGSISESFPDVLPDEICWPCFAKGAVEGLAVGAVAIAAIAAAPGWLAVGLTVGLAVVGAYGLAQLANNWGGMSDEAKSEALGNLAGGLIAGRFGGPLVPPKPLPVPGIVLMEVPGAGTVPVLVTTEVTATLAPGATVAAMAMGGGAGGSGEPPDSRGDEPQGDGPPDEGEPPPVPGSLPPRPPDSPNYSVAFEVQLTKNIDYPGRSRGAHFQECNRQLHRAVQSDLEFAAEMERLYPGIKEGVAPGARGAYPRNAPTPDVTWHHHADREGVMQLVPRNHHEAAGPVQESLHPNNRGGMENWGK